MVLFVNVHDVNIVLSFEKVFDGVCLTPFFSDFHFYLICILKIVLGLTSVIWRFSILAILRIKQPGGRCRVASFSPVCP